MKKPLSASLHRRDGRPALDIEEIGVGILNFLAADPERLERFLAITGLTSATLRAAANASGFGESLLDYLATDERLLTAFAEDQALDPARLEAYRQSLAPRGDDC